MPFVKCPRCEKDTLETFVLPYEDGTVLIVTCKNCGYEGRAKEGETLQASVSNCFKVENGKKIPSWKTDAELGIKTKEKLGISTPEEPKEEPKATVEPEIKHIKMDMTINPDYFRVRPQNKACNEKGCMCVSVRYGEEWCDMCDRITYGEDEKFHFDLRKCKHDEEEKENE